jgi:hypothetical protein
VLATNPTAQTLTRQEFEFENALLRSVSLALPRRKRGRRKDPATGEKFLRIWMLRSEGKNWRQIEEALHPQFGHLGQGAYKKLYQRHLPNFLMLFRKHFLPMVHESVFLPAALRAAKGQPGRPKSGNKSRK